MDYVAFPPLYEHFSAFQLDSLFRWPYVHPVNQPRFMCERLVYIAARTDSIQWTFSGHSTISLSIAVLIRLVWFDLFGVMQYMCVYLGVHFKLRMLSLGVMLYILIYVCRSLDSLQVFLYPSVNYLFPAWRDRFILLIYLSKFMPKFIIYVIVCYRSVLFSYRVKYSWSTYKYWLPRGLTRVGEGSSRLSVSGCFI